MSAHRGKILRVEGMAMPLSYRSFTRFTPKGVDYEHIVLEQFDKWLHDDPKANPRRFARDKLEMNSVIAYSPFSDVVLVERIERDGTKTIRARLSENKEERGQNELWISTLTVHLPAKQHDEGFFLFEMDSPVRTDHRGISRPVVPGNPGFMRRILELEEIELFDGHFATLRTEPRIVDVEDVEFLIHAACDPQRRGALVVMGTDESVPFSKQFELSKKLFGKISGVATSYVLTTEATCEFNEQIGPNHAVHGGSIRSYYPEVDLASKLDAWRHPFVKKEKIEELDGRVVTRMLESATRRLSLEAALPHSVQRIEARLTAAQNDAILGGKRIVAYTIATKADSKSTNTEDLSRSNTTEIQSEFPSVAKGAEEYLAIEAKLCEALGVKSLTIEVASSIADTLNRLPLISTQLTQLGQEVQDFKVQLGSLNDDLYELRFDQLEEYESRKRAEQYVEHVKKSLSSLTEVSDLREIKRNLNALVFGDQTWLTSTDLTEDFTPTDFSEIVSSLERLPYLVFTGDESEIEDLDRNELGVNAGKTWSGLRMLNDYGRAKSDGVSVTHIKDFLERSPSGYFSDWSTDKYAANESDTVDQNPSMRSQRTLPVPLEVNPSKKVYMPSHLKIGYKLRVHFHQDLSVTNKIYIGYIGRHLDTGSTN